MLEQITSALSVVVNAQADAQRSGSSVGIIGRTESTYRISAPATTNKPTTWDPSAIELTLPYPHIARLSRAFLFQAPGTIIDTPTC